MIWHNFKVIISDHIRRIILTSTESILKQALLLEPDERAKLIDKLLHSLENPDISIQELWAMESENRIDAYEKGEITAKALEEVLEKYK